MTSTVTLLQDHLGSDAPRVMGTEYVVDAIIDITSFNSSTTTTGTFVASANTFTRTSGDALPTLVAGQGITISNTESGTNDGATTIVSVSGDVITLGAVAGDEEDDEITFILDSEAIAYADFGLSTVSQVEILGQEKPLLNWRVSLGTDGNSEIADHLVLRCLTASSGALATGDSGTIRVRLHGQI